MYKDLTCLAALVTAILIALLAVGCNPQPLPAEPTLIPTLAPATLPSELNAASQTVSTRAAEPGGDVFGANCSDCHNLTTETKVGPGLAGLFNREKLPNDQPVNEKNLGEWILNGGGAMPGIPLSENELDALIAFLGDATQ